MNPHPHNQARSTPQEAMNSFPCKIIEADLDQDIVTLQMEGVYTVSAGQKYLCDAAPVAAQPDVTQQTLDDVMAGIPARDAEIEELRKEIETLRAQQDADKVDAALAEMVHAMFRSGNSVPVTRITIDRKQYDAAIDAARKEQA